MTQSSAESGGLLRDVDHRFNRVELTFRLMEPAQCFSGYAKIGSN
mgnify:CR=1 FL=1|jgi:hypothetical protein